MDSTAGQPVSRGTGTGENARMGHRVPLQPVALGTGPLDGPAWSRLGHLVMSDIERDAIVRYTPMPDPSSTLRSETAPTAQLPTVRAPSGGARGLTFDRQGRLLACETVARRLTRAERDGTITVLADEVRGRPLNGPRDVVHAIDGSTYFSDPTRGAAGAAEPGIYQVDRGGGIRLVAGGIERPTGVALSADHERLFVADAGGRVYRFRILADGGLDDRHVLATVAPENGMLGGLRTDVGGLVYCAAPDGVRVFGPRGAHRATLPTPERPTNVAWGEAFSTLYVTTTRGLYRTSLAATGTRTF